MKITKNVNKKKTKEADWIFLHPYVYVSIKQNHAILYNTLNGELLEYQGNNPVLKLIRRLNAETGLYVTKLYKQQYDKNIERFINQIRKHYMGDCLNTSLRPNTPFQMKPMLNLQKTLDFLITDQSSSRILVNDEIQDYLEVITLHINSRCNQTCTQCDSAYKQYFCCKKNNENPHEIEFDAIEKLTEEIKNSSLRKIRITGGNLLFYTELQKLIRHLDQIPVIKEFLINYLNIEDKPWFFEFLSKELSQLIIIIHFPIKIRKLESCLKILSQYHLKMFLLIVIEDDAQIKKIEDILTRLNIESFDFVPHYNGENLSFFKNSIFLTRQSIIATKPSMKNIFARKTINTGDFQKLTVLSNGDIYANLNHPKIGKLNSTSVFDIIFQELHRGKSWTKVRTRIKPCKSCAFNGLCPPISNYEYVLGKYNLCNIM
jgi:pseudo-rSAM protein